MVAEHVNKRNAGKPRVLTVNAFVHSLAALAVTLSGWLLLPLIMMQSHRQSEFCPNFMYREVDRG